MMPVGRSAAVKNSYAVQDMPGIIVLSLQLGPIDLLLLLAQLHIVFHNMMVPYPHEINLL